MKQRKHKHITFHKKKHHQNVRSINIQKQEYTCTMMPKRIIFQFLSYQFLLSVFYSICSQHQVWTSAKQDCTINWVVFLFFSGTQQKCHKFFIPLYVCAFIIIWCPPTNKNGINTKKGNWIEFSCCKEKLNFSLI